jgi:thiol-disulfide isomerase/thioredoxin
MKEEKVVKANKPALIIFLILLAAIILLVYLLAGSLKQNNNNPINTIPVSGSTFLDTGDQIIKDSTGKPYVILFSTTWCPHCQWIKDTFDSLATSELGSKVNLQHWEIDTGDNTLTPKVETQVPPDMLSIYNKYNPKGSIPTFVFGGKYMRIGNGYETQGDLNAELSDFKLIIGKLLE